MSFTPTEEQKKVFQFDKKNMIVSASAGSGKTFTLLEYIVKLVTDGQDIKRVLLLTFTKAAASEMKEKLIQKLYDNADSEKVLSAIDDVATADISTIHAFLQRIIKRSTNLLPIGEGFGVLSSEEIETLKQSAFEESEHVLRTERPEDYNYLYLNLHNNRELIFTILDSMSSFFATQENVDEKIRFFKANQKKFFDDSMKTLEEKFSKQIAEIKSNLSIARLSFDDEKMIAYIDSLEKLLSGEGDKIELYRKIATIELTCPRQSKKFDPMAFLVVKEESEKFKNIKQELAEINICEAKIFDEARIGKMENIFYDYYILFEKSFARFKEKLNAVDFNDLEKFADKILLDEEMKSQIQQSYDYVFVDEYQDTNLIQEALIKKVAREAKFIAVGDPKQGIYGFRNATSEIIKRDIKDFEKDENSTAEYLKKNFRSDSHILNFVNDVFEKVMTEESVGIDYLATSMLEAGAKDEYEDEELPNVRIDILQNQKEEKEEIKEKYNILDDTNYKKSTKNLEARAIAERIQQIMQRKIYDNATKSARNVSYKDIVILVRGGNDFVPEVIRELSRVKIPVVSEIVGNFKDYAEILTIINLFKIMLDFEDDTALISVMLSKIGGFSLDEITKLKLAGTEREFFNIVKASTDEKVQAFKEYLEKLKFDFDSKGALVMLEEVIDKSGYREYLFSKANAENYLFVLDKFIETIKSSEKQYDLAALVKFLEQEKIVYKGGGNSANAVSICTIHSSKGLEYPVVILAETGKSMLRSHRDNFILDSKRGLGLNCFSLEEDSVFTTPLVHVMRKEKRDREKNDEIMLLYVALTRPQKHLYITGTLTVNELDNICENPYDAKSFMEMILSANKKLVMDGADKEKRTECNVICEIEPFARRSTDFEGTINEDVVQKVKKYLDFKYPFAESSETIYKNSVSALNQKKEIVFVGKTDDEFVERGNAYHFALCSIDFERVNSLEDCKKLLSELQDESVTKYVEAECLFKSIMLLKESLQGCEKVFKETCFTSLVRPCELFEDGSQEEIMVQGVVDLFALGKENVLIDYKFTNDTNDESIKKRYEKQLLLYKYAIEKAYNITINKTFLLSLKNNKIIKF